MTTTTQLQAQLEQQQALDRDTLLAIQQIDYADRFAEDELRGTRDPRTGRFIRHSDYGSDDQLIVTFSTQAVLNKLESYKAKSPKYQDMDFITIIVPGNKDLTVHAPVTDFYEWRFPNEYAAYKSGRGTVQQGTLLSQWMELSPSQVKELEYFGVKTVEQIANLSDSSSGVLRSFYSMKEKARHFLEVAKDNEKTSLVTMQLEEQESKHAAEMAALNAKLEALMAMVGNQAPVANVAADEVEVAAAPAPSTTKKR